MSKKRSKYRIYLETKFYYYFLYKLFPKNLHFCVKLVMFHCSKIILFYHIFRAENKNEKIRIYFLYLNSNAKENLRHEHKRGMYSLIAKVEFIAFLCGLFGKWGEEKRLFSRIFSLRHESSLK